MTIVLLGASGFTGRLTAEALDARGVGFVAAGRSAAKIASTVGSLPTVSGVRVVDVDDRDSVARLCADADVLITTVGPFDRLGRGVLEAAVGAGIGYLDSTGEQSFVRWAFEHLDEGAHASGATAVPACGFDYVPGDVLAAVAAATVADPLEVHVAYMARGQGSPLRWLSRGTRTTVVDFLGRTHAALVHGELVDESIGQARRLAWFPRPVGPRHAAGAPGAEAFTVPRHVPGVETVRTYHAIPTALAELAQLGSNLTRLGPVKRVTRAWFERGPEGPDAQRRASTRWACVAEVLGRGGDVGRAWAYGTDPYGLTGALLAAVAVRLDAGRDVAGVCAPAQVVPPRELLDEMSERTDLRWSVRGPGDGDGGGGGGGVGGSEQP